MAAPSRRATRMSSKRDEAFLVQLGERIRSLRAMRGISRKKLAEGANVSERFLADLETGSGNASILLLRSISDALALPVTELIAADAPMRADLALAVRMLAGLSDDELESARNLLQSRFATEVASATRIAHIAFVGLRGAGKSTLARMLARHLNYEMVELDREIEKLTGMSLEETHVMLDQAAYRRYERQSVEQVIATRSHVVIETPGSLVSETDTYSYLLSHCLTVWIKASPEEHMARVVAQGDLRPMEGNSEAMDDLRRILAQREPYYAKADLVVDTSGQTIGASFDALLNAVAAHGLRPHQEAVPSIGGQNASGALSAFER